MHNACMQARYNHMNLVHTRHPSRMHLVCYIVYVYLASRTRTSRRDRMYKTLCYTRIQTRSRRTWVSSRFVCYIVIILISRRDVKERPRRDS